MEIVIKVSDEKYKAIKKCFENGCALSITDMAILNGTILPKGHGALKDADKLAVAIAVIRDRWNYYGNEYESAMYQAYDIAVDEIIDALTIIEADEEIEDGKDILTAMQESADAVRNSPQYDFSCVKELFDEEGAEK